MSEKFRNELQKKFDNNADDAFNYLAELTPEVNTVVQYRDDKNDKWKYAVIMSVHFLTTWIFSS